jgi:hypothetical protein
VKNVLSTSAVIISIVLGASGCAAPKTGVLTSTNSGLVNQIYTRHDLRFNAPSCLAALTQEQIAAGKYVQIRTRHSDQYHYFGAFVPPSLTVHIGDEVAFSSDQCDRSAIPQITKIINH